MTQISVFMRKRDHVIWGALWLLLVTTGCNSGTECVTLEGLAIPVQLQANVEREWRQVSLRQLYEVPRESGIESYMPGPFRIGSDGALYYMDPGDMKIKHFDADGYFKHSYGGQIKSE